MHIGTKIRFSEIEVGDVLSFDYNGKRRMGTVEKRTPLVNVTLAMIVPSPEVDKPYACFTASKIETPITRYTQA